MRVLGQKIGFDAEQMAGKVASKVVFPAAKKAVDLAFLLARHFGNKTLVLGGVEEKKEVPNESQVVIEESYVGVSLKEFNDPQILKAFQEIYGKEVLNKMIADGEFLVLTI